MATQILIAEDIPALLSLFRDEFSTQYDVLTASDGAEALNRLRENPDVQLLLSDIRMPHVDGFSLAEQALALNPDLKIMLMSAFSDPLPSPSLLLARKIRVLHKPFGMSKAASLIEEMLARP